MATATVDAILRPLEQGGLLGNKVVYRYTAGRTQDGLRGAEGTFNLCAFWLVEALTRAGRFDPRPPRGGAPDRRARAGLRHPPDLDAEETAADGSHFDNTGLHASRPD